MRSVLGIDAAWTEKNPSGVALAVEVGGRWRLTAVETSYARFQALPGGGLARDERAAGSTPNASGLLAACFELTGGEPDLIAVDMPLALHPIVGRRPSDTAVSSAYGARKCATHSPGAERPGKISDDLRAGFAARGYPLWTKPAAGPPRRPPGLIEVYPHPALVQLTGANERLPYKAGKLGKYYLGAPPEERKRNLFETWSLIVRALEVQIEGVGAGLAEISYKSSGASLKAYEDALDAIVCAWVGICALEGSVEAYGDAESAIWVPLSRLPLSQSKPS